MTASPIDRIRAYYDAKIAQYGASPQGVDWNSARSQELRFAQLLKICNPAEPFSLGEFGCGYGALCAYLNRHRIRASYEGFDISEAMIAAAREHCQGLESCIFHAGELPSRRLDYCVASGLFNVRFDIGNDDWEAHILDVIHKMDRFSIKGFSFNCLTKYSDAEKMRADLYYADPAYFFDYCKRNFSRHVSLLHDYDLYEFTILVRRAPETD